MKKEAMNSDCYLDKNVFIIFPLLVLVALTLRYSLGVEITPYKIKEENQSPLPIETIRDINYVSIEEIDVIPGIGEKTATKIVKFRSDLGAILDMELLLKPFGPLNPTQFFAIRCYLDIFKNNH